jgi:diaminohydroxyphosphoribosylaminopyrimidine deaminase/5-amino-6-(5-phosphoribosylamino)uracil reductase
VVIVESRLRTPANAQLFAINNIAAQAVNMRSRSVFIYTNSHDLDKRKALESCGATVIVLPQSEGFGASQKINLQLMMQDLAEREINELHVEAGATLNGALIASGLVDEFLVYLAPKLLGASDANGRGMADFAPLANLTHALPLDFVSVDKVGADVRLLARVIRGDKGQDAF